MSAGAPEAHRGLAGVVADTTAVSVIDEATGVLLYRGYPVPELAASCSFEEVAYLIWYGELPTTEQLEAFTAAERSERDVPRDLTDALAKLPLTCDPMDLLRTAVSYLGALEPRPPTTRFRWPKRACVPRSSASRRWSTATSTITASPPP